MSISDRPLEKKKKKTIDSSNENFIYIDTHKYDENFEIGWLWGMDIEKGK